MITFSEFRFPVSDGHELQVYDGGARDGEPVIFLHGGPGSGFLPKRMYLLDLTQVRVIGFDQRGAGKSTPRGFDGLENNTTQKLVDDIEALRLHLKLGPTVIMGGSWGSTLAIEYAKAYPKSVKQLILFSSFTARKEDQEWSFEGVKQFFPDAYADLAAGIPAGQKPQNFLYEGLMSKDAARMADAAFRFERFGNIICSLESKPFAREDVNDDTINRARILLDYAAKDFYIDPVKGVFDGIEALKDIPTAIIHGRYDMDCRPESAALLASKLPRSTLRFALGNHSPGDPDYKAAIIETIAQVIAGIRAKAA